MRRTIMAGMALALTLGVASVSQAQQTDRPSKPDSAQHEGHMRGERGPRGGRGAGMLLKGIDLTDAQKAQLKALHEKDGKPAEMRREERAKLRAAMQERHEKMLDDVRSILTPAQKEIFEKNVVEMKERMKTRQEHMKHHREEARKS